MEALSFVNVLSDELGGADFLQAYGQVKYLSTPTPKANSEFALSRASLVSNDKRVCANSSSQKRLRKLVLAARASMNSAIRWPAP